MDAEDSVRRHYSRTDLEDVVRRALVDAGADIDALQLDDLAGLDHLHAGFAPATAHLLDRLALDQTSTLLDVGCGIGGPARMAAARHGCRVTGVDLSPDFVSLAWSLTRMVGLDGLVSFDVGSATDLPYEDASFSHATMNHVGMNIPDKARVFGEVRRVLQPGGRFAVYEQMRIGEGAITYPLPWAEDERSSFVARRDEYAELLEAAGFAVDEVEDRTAANAAGGPPAATTLNPGILFGPGFRQRMANNIAAAATGTLGAVLMIARAA